MIAADLRRGERLRVPYVRVADDGEMVAEGFERRQARRAEIEITADRCRGPEVLLDPERRAAGRYRVVYDNGSENYYTNFESN